MKAMFEVASLTPNYENQVFECYRCGHAYTAGYMLEVTVGEGDVIELCQGECVDVEREERQGGSA